MYKFNGTYGPWMYVFNPIQSPLYPNGTWIIKGAGANNNPIANVLEPLGGVKNDFSLSEQQTCNAVLIASAPELLEALEHCVEALKIITSQASKPIIERAERAIEKATVHK